MVAALAKPLTARLASELLYLLLDEALPIDKVSPKGVPAALLLNVQSELHTYTTDLTLSRLQAPLYFLCVCLVSAFDS